MMLQKLMRWNKWKQNLRSRSTLRVLILTKMKFMTRLEGKCKEINHRDPLFSLIFLSRFKWHLQGFIQLSLFAEIAYCIIRPELMEVTLVWMVFLTVKWVTRANFPLLDPRFLSEEITITTLKCLAQNQLKISLITNWLQLLDSSVKTTTTAITTEEVVAMLRKEKLQFLVKETLLK